MHLFKKIHHKINEKYYLFLLNKHFVYIFEFNLAKVQK